MKHPIESALFLNMVLIENDQSVLVEKRTKTDWPGITLPGGHVEPGESFVQAAMREVKEETGLTVSHLKLVGVCQYPDQKENQTFRRVILFYRTTDFKGSLHDSREGHVFWMTKNDFEKRPLASALHDFLRLYQEDFSEVAYRQGENRQWETFYF